MHTHHINHNTIGNGFSVCYFAQKTQKKTHTNNYQKVGNV